MTHARRAATPLSAAAPAVNSDDNAGAKVQPTSVSVPGQKMTVSRQYSAHHRGPRRGPGPVTRTPACQRRIPPPPMKWRW